MTDPRSWESELPALAEFQSVSLADLNKVALMSRVDSKYTLHIGRLNELLQVLSKHYDVLQIEQCRIFRYVSQYYDTPDFQFYNDHHNGKPNRTKVRTRLYVESGTSFLEVKKKIKGNLTEKSREALVLHGDQTDIHDARVLHQASIDGHSLIPTLEVTYSRITLSSRSIQERVTIDLGLTFRFGSRTKVLDGLVIIEVKQDKIKRESPVIMALRQRQMRPLRISKYAMGMVLMEAVEKINAFRFKLHKLTQLINQYGSTRSSH